MPALLVSERERVAWVLNGRRTTWGLGVADHWERADVHLPPELVSPGVERGRFFLLFGWTEGVWKVERLTSAFIAPFRPVYGRPIADGEWVPDTVDLVFTTSGAPPFDGQKARQGQLSDEDYRKLRARLVEIHPMRSDDPALAAGQLAELARRCIAADATEAFFALRPLLRIDNASEELELVGETAASIAFDAKDDAPKWRAIEVLGLLSGKSARARRALDALSNSPVLWTRALAWAIARPMPGLGQYDWLRRGSGFY